jgi:hypothetical protein
MAKTGIDKYLRHSDLFGILLMKKDSRQAGMTQKSTSCRVKKRMLSFLLPFAVCCLLSTVLSCGYAIHGKASLPFHEVQIGIIENRTVEPKLQDKLYQALTDEFLRQGIAVYRGADYQLKGKINHFELRVLSETSDVATEYEVIIKGEFTATGPSGYVKDLKGFGSPFIISFSAADTLTGLLALKDLASDRAIRDMAQQIVAALIYR